jgi:hypothetical protein
MARALTPDRAKQTYQQWRRNRRVPSASNGLINPEFAVRIRLDERMDEEYLVALRKRQSDPQGYRMDRLIEHVCSGLSGYSLVAGRQGVEVRDPWSDIRVLELLLALPDTYKTRRGWTKYPIRNGFRNDIEPSVLQRKDKTHVGWKMVTRALDAAHERLSDSIEQDLSLVEEYIDVPAFRNLARSFVRRRDMCNYLPIFEILSLQFWLKRIHTL